MKKVLTIFVLGFLVAAGLGFAANYSVIRSNDGWFLERKDKMTLEDAYVDTRNWGLGDFLKHPAIAAALTARGFKKAFKEEAPSVGDKAKEAVEKGRKAVADGL